MIETKCGRIEYGDAGDGAPVLLVHGAGGGYDQGLLLGDLLVGSGFRLIAPSRFGYLQSPVEQIEAPALVIHACDDSLVDWSNGRHAAANITGAEFMTLERGGHFLLGHYDAIRTRVAAFLARVFEREEMPGKSC